jgi:glyoxylase-like metal-dependent hydrolase (beta-lactamase superfamily II)/rhodanese-related sulfurtransferase
VFIDLRPIYDKNVRFILYKYCFQFVCLHFKKLARFLFLLLFCLNIFACTLVIIKLTIKDNGKNSNNKKNNSLQIKPSELKKKIDDGEDIYILDVRDPQEHNAWKVFYDRYEDTPLIPLDKLSSAEMMKNIPKDKEVVTFCARGNRSMSAAQMLSEKGFNVRSMEGGLTGWNAVYDVSPITLADHNSNSISSFPSSSHLMVWQIRRISRGCMSYVIANLTDKEAAVIDPTCEVGDCIDMLVNDNSLKITSLIDTHLHADHLSGISKLAKKYGSRIYVSSLEPYKLHDSAIPDGFIIDQVKDGNKINLGSGVILDAIHTPGHTNGSMCYKLHVDMGDNMAHDDFAQNNDAGIPTGKTYLFTGDTLFVDGVGRPDLYNKAEEFSRNLFNSYRQKILSLPEDSIVLPSHFSGRFEHGKPIYGTIKSVKEKIQKVSAASEDGFVKFVVNGIPSQQPMNYEKIISINKIMTPCDLVGQNELEIGPNSCGIRA